ncbi:formate dehydrogenase accessory sulfurtransferase FdhD [Candidatus Acidianus copahuensis]|uniref:formate dehydrogenase accessory sulfurtransferase FdhD n=1 Tax=Candidatus Acidianus copahuensis TaxID=1160895 RepID=UPI00064F45B8|nr:formate dehydrogenase accessory sulfurtransferase FdhD [Candidatus Acidianus copahuensis]
MEKTRGIRSVKVLKFNGGKLDEEDDAIAEEEPLSLKIFGKTNNSEIIIMRTPGNDIELVTGFLYTEGMISSSTDILSFEEGDNEIIVRIRGNPTNRQFIINSSCGFCGKNKLNEIGRVSYNERIDINVLVSLPIKLLESQRIYHVTGGVHGASVFNILGDLESSAEDVGRHNAVDKAIGKLVLKGEIPARRKVLQVSGRIGYEIVYKASIAGISFVTGISAPTSMAVSYAEAIGMTVVGFTREGKMNIYSHPERILID